MQQNPDITFTVAADTLDEAVQCAIEELQAITTTQGYRGFETPELTSEFYLADPWRRCFEFHATFFPAT